MTFSGYGKFPKSGSKFQSAGIISAIQGLVLMMYSCNPCQIIIYNPSTQHRLLFHVMVKLNRFQHFRPTTKHSIFTKHIVEQAPCSPHKFTRTFSKPTSSHVSHVFLTQVEVDPAPVVPPWCLSLSYLDMG